MIVLISSCPVPGRTYRKLFRNLHPSLDSSLRRGGLGSSRWGAFVWKLNSQILTLECRADIKQEKAKSHEKVRNTRAGPASERRSDDRVNAGKSGCQDRHRIEASQPAQKSQKDPFEGREDSESAQSMKPVFRVGLGSSVGAGYLSDSPGSRT